MTAPGRPEGECRGAQHEGRPVTAPLLQLSGVHTHIGAYHILHGVDLAVPAGEVTMLLGRNGAGKTTTLRTVMGLWAASSGAVRFGGRVIGGGGGGGAGTGTGTGTAGGKPKPPLGTPDIARLGIGYVPENMGIFGDLTVRENLLLAARGARTIEQIDTARLDWLFGLFPALKKFWLYPAGKLSGGQKQMLSIARAMVEPRRLLLIDEPSKGLAPAIVQNLIAALRELKSTKTTVLLVEQNFAVAKALGDRVAVMDDGRVVHAGSMAELADDEALQQRFLGLSLGAHA